MIKRPFVTLYILMSIDGQITGPFGKAPAAKESGKVFSEFNFDDKDGENFHFQGWLYGSKTSLSYFTHEISSLPENDVPVPSGDFLPDQNASRYYIALDRTGKLGWESNLTAYNGHSANVLEVITEQVSNKYKAFLRKKNIPYIICGATEIDLELMLSKLYSKLNMTHVMLGGGGILNWSFVSAGLCDEVNFVIAPAIDGTTDSTPVFNGAFSKNHQPIGFKLKSIEVYEKNTILVKYLVDKKNI